MNRSYVVISFFVCLLVFMGCKHQKGTPVESLPESTEAKELLQGIWCNPETEEAAVKVKGDTVYYADTISMPVYFKVVGDSLMLGQNHYKIVKHSANVFCFRNHSGDEVRLVKSNDPADEFYFTDELPQTLTMSTEVVKTDSVVMFNGQKYHWYVAVNPTRYKVVATSYNGEGVEVENVYYDNIIHISLFKGAECVFSKDFNKQQYADFVPAQFMEQSILANMQFDQIDNQGFHFNATLCSPGRSSCYMLATNISFEGKVTMDLLEY